MLNACIISLILLLDSQSLKYLPSSPTLCRGQSLVWLTPSSVLCNTIPASLSPLQPLWSFCSWSKAFPLQDQSKYCVFSLLTIMLPTGLSLNVISSKKPPVTYPLSASKDWLTSSHCFSDPSLSFLACEKNSGIYFISGSPTVPHTPGQHEVHLYYSLICPHW